MQSTAAVALLFVATVALSSSAFVPTAGYGGVCVGGKVKAKDSNVSAFVDVS